MSNKYHGAFARLMRKIREAEACTPEERTKEQNELLDYLENGPSLEELSK